MIKDFDVIKLKTKIIYVYNYGDHHYKETDMKNNFKKVHLFISEEMIHIIPEIISEASTSDRRYYFHICTDDLSETEKKYVDMIKVHNYCKLLPWSKYHTFSSGSKDFVYNICAATLKSNNKHHFSTWKSSLRLSKYTFPEDEGVSVQGTKLCIDMNHVVPNSFIKLIGYCGMVNSDHIGRAFSLVFKYTDNIDEAYVDNNLQLVFTRMALASQLIDVFKAAYPESKSILYFTNKESADFLLGITSDKNFHNSEVIVDN